MINFIESPLSIPTKTLSDGRINQDYLIWDQRDQQLLSWSINHEFLSHLVGCNTSFKVWNRLEELYHTRSKANILQYKIELQTLKKENLKMT